MNFISRVTTRLAYKWWVTIAVTLGMLMSLMDATIVNVTIPQMQHAFHANLHDVQWVVTIYMLTQAAVIPTAPYLTARFGGKRTYVWTLSAFLLGSLLCGFAWNLPSLIIFRFIQGIGGGILLPLVMTLQYQAFAPEERGTASSVMGLALMVAPVMGPVLGGYLVSTLGWQWAFFINVPIGIIAVAVAQKLLKHTPGQKGLHFDLAGFVTAATGSAMLVYAVSSIASGDNVISNVFLFCGSIIILCAFVVIELRKARKGQEPLLDLRIFEQRTFAFSNITLVIYSFIWFGLLFLISIYLQTLHQETAFQAGMIQGVQAIATLLLLPLAGRFSDKLGPQPIALTGLIILTGAISLMLLLTLNTPLWLIIGILFLLGCSTGLTGQIPVSAMSRIEKDAAKEVAHGSTLVTVLRAVAAPLGVAVLSSFVQGRSQYYVTKLTAQHLTGNTLLRQSTLQAMHDSFIVMITLAICALVIMYFVPRRRYVTNIMPLLVPNNEELREQPVNH